MGELDAFEIKLNFLQTAMNLLHIRTETFQYK